MDKDEEEDEVKPTFRIRFTISNNSKTTNSDSPESPCNDSHQKDQHQSSHWSNETHKCNHQIDPPGTKRHLSTCESSTEKKKFEFIQPQNHKSSLFVNLSDIGSSQRRKDNQLFISPDLNQFHPASPPSPVESTLCAPRFEQVENISFSETSSVRTSDEDSTMSQGCNFINSWVTASRRRASSVTPQAQAKTGSNTNKGRRASSSNDLAEQVPPNNPMANKSPSGNHLAVNMSNETICGNDLTQTSRQINNGGYIQHSEINMMRSLQIDFQESDPTSAEHPTSLNDILQIDLDSLRLEDECKNLESQVDYWEKRVEERERQRFEDDVPRTLVEKILKERKKLRDLECQIFELNFELEESEKQSQKLSPSPISNFNYELSGAGCKLSTGKFGSHIRPGQENTVDILDAIPPSGSLQCRQYLSRASTGTDSSEYAQMPTFEQHKHQLPMHSQPLVLSDDSMSVSNNEIQQRRRDHYHHNRNHASKQTHRVQQQVYVQLENVEHKSSTDERRYASSPIRPNHFKGDFRSAHAIVSQDSSSTASSSSPH